MSYFDLINKALDEDQLLSCVLGFDEYHLRPQDPMNYDYQDYNTLLDFFDIYQQQHPESQLLNKYEDLMEEIFAQDPSWASTICEAAKCILTHVNKETTEEDFHFRLSDPNRFLKLASDTIHNNKDSFIANLSEIDSENKSRLKLDNLENKLSGSIKN